MFMIYRALIFFIYYIYSALNLHINVVAISNLLECWSSSQIYSKRLRSMCKADCMSLSW